MQIKKNYDLSKLNTFGVNATAKLFTEINSEAEIKELFDLPEFKQNKKMFLGGGSNVLFTKDFDGLVVLNKLKGMEIVNKNSETAEIRAAGGEAWDDLVKFSVNHGLWGIENLSLIPGTVGAAPMQNIGAYGVEVKDTLFSIEAFDIENGKENKKKIFSKEECGLGYRESVFKNELKDKYFIGAVTFILSKIPKPNISYKILKDYLEKNNIEPSSSKNISDAIIAIRKSKLPDPKILGNAGSFFKNIFITKEQLHDLQVKFPDIPHFEEETSPDLTNLTPAPSPGRRGGVVKIPAGWLIEQCEWKGKRIGNVGVHEKQALVLVNYGGATGGEILELANKIITSVKEKFGLKLSPEVNLI